MSTNSEPAETLQWIKDWRDDMFSSTSRDRHGWPIEMHGLVSSYEELAAENEWLRAALEATERDYARLLIEVKALRAATKAVRG